MLILTTESVPGKKIKEVVGLVKGSTIRAKHIGKDIGAGFKQLVGGELTGYDEMLTEARKIAIYFFKVKKPHFYYVLLPIYFALNILH